MSECKAIKQFQANIYKYPESGEILSTTFQFDKQFSISAAYILLMKL